ncbi:MAG: biopolymer transporter ExbD [Campylobacterales bacterium]|nr:biopolymer transporter ExbD [Campylobacterales bacterium]
MRREKFDKINIVPFIDIVLVLLVIVLATASFIEKTGIDIDLPTASSQSKVDPKNITITIDAKGSYFYDKKAVSLDEVKENIMTLDPSKDNVTITTDKASSFESFVAIIDILKSKNFEKISILTKRD